MLFSLGLFTVSSAVLIAAVRYELVGKQYIFWFLFFNGFAFVTSLATYCVCFISSPGSGFAHRQRCHVRTSFPWIVAYGIASAVWPIDCGSLLLNAMSHTLRSLMSVLSLAAIALLVFQSAGPIEGAVDSFGETVS